MTRILARFILIGLETGSRHDDMAESRWARNADKHGYFCFVDDIFYRQGSGAENEIKPAPAVAMTSLLRTYLLGCRRRDLADPAYVAAGDMRVIHNGRGGPFLQFTKFWDRVRKDAGLDHDVVPHTLRYTKATWLLEQGATEEETADFLGITVETLLKIYAQIDPAMSVEAAEAFDRAVGRTKVARTARITEARAAAARRAMSGR